jgi:pyruvate/2-oxoacid:ferredoxin oxidoreductase beta subunit
MVIIPVSCYGSVHGFAVLTCTLMTLSLQTGCIRIMQPNAFMPVWKTDLNFNEVHTVFICMRICNVMESISKL